MVKLIIAIGILKVLFLAYLFLFKKESAKSESLQESKPDEFF